MIHVPTIQQFSQHSFPERIPECSSITEIPRRTQDPLHAYNPVGSALQRPAQSNNLTSCLSFLQGTLELASTRSESPGARLPQKVWTCCSVLLCKVGTPGIPALASLFFIQKSLEGWRDSKEEGDQVSVGLWLGTKVIAQLYSEKMKSQVWLLWAHQCVQWSQVCMFVWGYLSLGPSVCAVATGLLVCVRIHVEWR